MKDKLLIKYLIIILILSIPSFFTLFKTGFFTTDDGNWMIIRFSAFYEALKNGQFPVRFLPRLNNDFGYPVANFLYPLFMYIGVPIHLLGFSFVNTIKIIFGLSLISSAFFSFMWLRKKFDNLSSMIGSLVYLYFPYHLWDVYKRGSVGEVLALSIIPFIFWQIERNSLFFVSIGIAALVLSHNTLALLFFPIIIFYYYFSQKKIKKILTSLIFGLGISCFFWFPAIYERRFVVFDRVLVSDYSNYFINFHDLNLIGLVFLISFLFTFVFVKKIKDRSYWLFFASSVIVLFLLFPISDFIWQVISSYIQFPFRFISILVLTTTFLIAYQLSLIKGKQKIILLGIYLVFLVFGAKDFIYPKEFTNYPDAFYSTNQDTTTVKNEYIPNWVNKLPISNSLEKVQIIKGKGEIKNLINKGSKISFTADIKEKSLISINTIYYPGWMVVVNREKAMINHNNEGGLIQFNLNSGSHFVQVYFTETQIRLFADIFSLISLLILCLISFFRYKIE